MPDQKLGFLPHFTSVNDENLCFQIRAVFVMVKHEGQKEMSERKGMS